MAEEVLQFNVASMVEDVLQQHGKRLANTDNLASSKAEEASLRRYEAAEWVRKMVGVVLGKDLPAEPSVEDFRIGLRSGIILCTLLNKIQPASVPKVVEAPVDTVIIPDGASLTTFQYFENVRNFLAAIQDMGIPTFEVSDLEHGGDSSRIVNCIVALKSYHEWKQAGANGVWKFSGNPMPCITDDISSADLSEMGTSSSFQRLVRELLADKSAEEIPIILENIISEVKEEFERRLEKQTILISTGLQDKVVPTGKEKKDAYAEIGATSQDESDSTSCMSTEIEATSTIRKPNGGAGKNFCNEASGTLSLNHQDLQHRTVEELRKILYSTKQGMHMLQLKYQEDVDSLGKQVVRLATQASGYQKVLEENRKLYNQVQDLKGNIRVYCRVRPFLPGQANGLNILDEIVDNTLTIQSSAKHGNGKKTFTFNKAFGTNSTQEEVFADTQPLIRSVLDGYNVCIFAYGQTGSGKTYTMTGPKELTKESLGVNYRALSDLFEISEERKDMIVYNIYVQMMEIYNEQVRDLLVTDGGNKRLEIRNNSSNGINVPNANLVNVTSTSDVIDLMNLGHKNRAVGSTSMNDRSSRSHSCLTVHVEGKDLTSGTTLRGCMHLVDLAGSERCDKTDAVGERLKEAQHINRSLSALGDVIAALAQKNAHVPYRNSKLTQLLQDSLGGQAKTLMFVHISPEPDSLGETLSTLKFAERVSTVELGAAKSNKDTSAPEVKELKEQIAMLKAELARKEEAANNPGSPTSASVLARKEEAANNPGSPTSALKLTRKEEAANNPRSPTSALKLARKEEAANNPRSPTSASVLAIKEEAANNPGSPTSALKLTRKEEAANNPGSPTSALKLARKEEAANNLRSATSASVLARKEEATNNQGSPTSASKLARKEEAANNPRSPTSASVLARKEEAAYNPGSPTLASVLARKKEAANNLGSPKSASVLARKEEAANNPGSPTSSLCWKKEDQSNFCSRRFSLDSQDAWPTIQEAVSSPSRRQSLASPVNTRHSLDQNYIQKSTMVASKLKHPVAKPVKPQETRCQIPQSSGRVRGHSPLNKAARPTSTLVRRKTAGGK
ncbi:kinesin-like protein KIN-14I isoform X2 [Salvia splendens]|uniref:kinesin-like protein KIN-14I isoform X2 n=1 Tax=Salvia splendens TaxID=180675 RepID=UPI001C2705DF|nr:kinesin-like protein KIN-14I isoform X2 [Salvia splendens]